jgi:AAA domain
MNSSTDAADTGKSFVINVIGGPGIGKSTLYSLIYARMKIRRQSVEQVQEYAKKLVWAEDFEKLDNQYYVTMQQYSELASVYGKVKFVITDGSLLHGLYYNRTNPTNVSNRDVTEKKIIELYSKFNNINIFLTRGSFPYEQAGRIQDAEEAVDVDRELKTLLATYGINFRTFSSDESQVDEIITHILDLAK